MTTSRRSFFKCLVGAFVASAIELNLTVEPRVGEFVTTARISNEMLNRIYAQLIASAT